MREIKFRAWDTSKKEMFDDFYVNHYGGVSYWNSKLGMLQEADDCLVMQFTGLLDRSGKEIYEGDVVKAIGRYVSSMDGSVSPLSEVKVVEICPHRTTGVYYDADYELEVIGNIYENPELIK